MTGDAAVAAYEEAVAKARPAIRAVVEAAAAVARRGLPSCDCVDLATATLRAEVAAARESVMDGRHG